MGEGPQGREKEGFGSHSNKTDLLPPPGTSRDNFILSCIVSKISLRATKSPEMQLSLQKGFLNRVLFSMENFVTFILTSLLSDLTQVEFHTTVEKLRLVFSIKVN